jgi:hypothetical protein
MDKIGNLALQQDTKTLQHYGVYVLQLMRYARACVSYPELLDIAY